MPLTEIFSLFNLGAKVTTLPKPGIIFKMHPYIPDLLGRPQSLDALPVPDKTPQVMSKGISA